MKPDYMTLRKDNMGHHTYADYLNWPDRRSGELIDGTAYVREPPGPSYLHQAIVFELGRQIGNALIDTPYRACTAPLDIRLPKSTEEDGQIDTVLQPDVFIVCELQKLDDRGMRGAPDWLAEVLSPGTAKYDQSIKLPVYERAGVREVWLIRPENRSVAIHRLEAGRYQRPLIQDLNGSTRLSAVPSVTVDWDRLIARSF